MTPERSCRYAIAQSKHTRGMSSGSRLLPASSLEMIIRPFVAVGPVHALGLQWSRGGKQQAFILTPVVVACVCRRRQWIWRSMRIWECWKLYPWILSEVTITCLMLSGISQSLLFPRPLNMCVATTLHWSPLHSLPGICCTATVLCLYSSCVCL